MTSICAARVIEQTMRARYAKRTSAMRKPIERRDAMLYDERAEAMLRGKSAAHVMQRGAAYECERAAVNRVTMIMLR